MSNTVQEKAFFMKGLEIVNGDFSIKDNILLNNDWKISTDNNTDVKLDELYKKLEEVKDSNYLNIGNSWRFRVEGDELSLEKLENNEWVQKQSVM